MRKADQRARQAEADIVLDSFQQGAGSPATKLKRVDRVDTWQVLEPRKLEGAEARYAQRAEQINQNVPAVRSPKNGEKRSK